MSVEAVAQKWYDRLLSAEPIDHERAEAAVAKFYQSGGLATPAKYLWCASPLEAIWAALVLIGKRESYNIPLLQDLGRTMDGPDKLVKAQQFVAGKLGISTDQVEGHFGMPFYQADKKLLSLKVAKDRLPMIVAASMAGKGWQVGDAGPFEALDRLELAIHQDVNDGGVLSRSVAAAGAKQIRYLAGRSAQHNLYGNLAYGELARDEALAERGEGELGELSHSLWAAYESCGMWWPMTEGVVFSERPVSAEPTSDGVRLGWSDGFGLVAPA